MKPKDKRGRNPTRGAAVRTETNNERQARLEAASTYDDVPAHPNERSRLDGILSSAGDDAPRLVYAAELEALGDPRGDFIRLQCELEHLAANDPQKVVVEARANQLASAYALSSSPWGSNPAKCVSRGHAVNETYCLPAAH